MDEWRGYGLDFTIPRGTRGVLAVCLCVSCSSLCGICGECVGGWDQGLEGRGGVIAV